MATDVNFDILFRMNDVQNLERVKGSVFATIWSMTAQRYVAGER